MLGFGPETPKVKISEEAFNRLCVDFLNEGLREHEHLHFSTKQYGSFLSMVKPVSQIEEKSPGESMTEQFEDLQPYLKKLIQTLLEHELFASCPEDKMFVFYTHQIGWPFLEQRPYDLPKVVYNHLTCALTDRKDKSKINLTFEVKNDESMEYGVEYQGYLLDIVPFDEYTVRAFAYSGEKDLYELGIDEEAVTKALRRLSLDPNQFRGDSELEVPEYAYQRKAKSLGDNPSMSLTPLLDMCRSSDLSASTPNDTIGHDKKNNSDGYKL